MSGDKSFEEWLDEIANEHSMNHPDHAFIKGARAAWAKAQEDDSKSKFGSLWAGKYYDKVEELNIAIEKLAIAVEALEMYSDPNWCVEHYNNDFIYKYAKQALSKIRAE